METASDCLYRHIGHNLWFDLREEQINRIVDAMKYFAAEHIREFATSLIRIQHDRLHDKKEIRRLTTETINNTYPLKDIK